MSVTYTTSTVGSCEWCKSFHSTVCPLVRSIEYFKDGSLKKVEFHAPQPVQYIPAQPVIPIQPNPQPWNPSPTWTCISDQKFANTVTSVN